MPRSNTREFVEAGDPSTTRIFRLTANQQALSTSALIFSRSPSSRHRIHEDDDPHDGNGICPISAAHRAPNSGRYPRAHTFRSLNRLNQTPQFIDVARKLGWNERPGFPDSTFPHWLLTSAAISTFAAKIAYAFE